ncbi:MAG TPA: TolC family protein [Bacteroidota bacterium]|nr:TolC family protein [Bacteroidota bacterium]
MKIQLCLVAGIAMLGATLHAQPKSLTLDEAITIGVENSRVLHASLMKTEYADAKSGEVSAGLYPSLKAQLGYQNLSNIPVPTVVLPRNAFGPGFPPQAVNVTLNQVILNNYTARATLQQPLFTGWKLQSAADNAEYAANAAHNDYDKDKQQLVYDIKSAYWNVYRAKEMKRLTDENVAQMVQHLDDVQNMFKQGMATTNEVLKTKVQLANARVLQSDAENSVTVATISFNSTVGLPLNTALTTTTPLTPTTKEFPEVDRLLADAFKQRADVQGMEWRVRAAETGVTAARGGWLPQIFLTGNYYYARPNPRIFPAQDEFKDSWDIGVNLQFDIWNNLSTVHQTSEATAQYEQAKDSFALLKDGVTLDVTQSYLAFRQAKKKIELAQLSVDQATENLRVTREKFKAELTTNSELLDAEVTLLQAKVQLVQSLVEHELAEARLEKAVGEGS